MKCCPTCGKRIGKWDQIFERLLAGEIVELPNANAAKNAHHMAEKRGLRVSTCRNEAHYLVKLIRRAVS